MTARLLHLLRHGAPITPDLMMGRTDGAPSTEGVAACLDRVRDLTFAAVLSSDLERARVPARVIADATGAALHVDPRWREMDFGLWDGSPSASIAPHAFAAFHDDPDAHPPPQGEGWSDLVARVSAALMDLPHQDVLVVTHGGAIRAALARLCGFARRDLWAFDLPYAALLSIRRWPDFDAAQIVGLRT